MGTLISRKLNKDDIDVKTDREDPVGRGIKKNSSTTVHATDTSGRKGVKVGISILNGQAIKEFRINGKEISKLYFSQAVTDELTTNFPPAEGKNEQWWGYFLTLKVKPGTMNFKTVLHLDPVDLKYPDSQTVPILVCYEDQDLKPSNAANILKGHSVFTALNPSGKSKKLR